MFDSRHIAIIPTMDDEQTRVVPSQNNDSRESEMDIREKIGIAKIIHKIA